jgi:hypothetical protein
MPWMKVMLMVQRKGGKVHGAAVIGEEVVGSMKVWMIMVRAAVSCNSVIIGRALR